MSEILVEIKNISKVFDPKFPPALNDVNTTIARGKIIGLAGPDGAGKTTLIRLIAGLLRPTTGEITVDGFSSLKDVDQVHQITGYMPQKFGLYEDLSVIQNLNLYADLSGVIGKEREESFKRLLAFTNLAPFVNRLAGRLSGGMKQKLGLACTLIRKPTLLLLDEPSVGVDPISRRELWKMVSDLLKENISVVWSTAYLDEAAQCDEVILLNEGKQLFDGTPTLLTARVKDRVFRISQVTNRRQVLSKALNAPNILDGAIQGDDVRVLTAEKKDPPFDLKALEAGPNAKIIAGHPRFEDGFMDILGGGPGGTSVLAEKTPLIKSKESVIIKSEGLTKKFGSFIAADHVTFEIKTGEIFGLLGPNGAGKSTTFKMMCGLLRPTSGEGFINGVDLLTAPGKARSQIGYMAQKFSLYSDLTVQQNLDFFAGIYNLKGETKREAIQEMIEIFHFKQYVNEVSGNLPLGYKQRLALACAMMHHPSVLFLDEPTSGVDPITRREFWNHINGLVEKRVTVMVTTHFMDEAEYCDRIGLIYRSKLIRVGTPDSLKQEAKTPDNPSPKLEDAFIKLIEQYDKENPI